MNTMAELTLTCGCRPRPLLDTMADAMPGVGGTWHCPLHGAQGIMAVSPERIGITDWLDGNAACRIVWYADAAEYGYTLNVANVVSQCGLGWDNPHAAIGAAYRALDAISIELAANA